MVFLQALVLAGLQSADSIVLGSGSADTPDAEADARVLAGLLQVRQHCWVGRQKGDTTHV